jgi:hypothetical protein
MAEALGWKPDIAGDWQLAAWQEALVLAKWAGFDVGRVVAKLERESGNPLHLHTAEELEETYSLMQQIAGNPSNDMAADGRKLAIEAANASVVRWNRARALYGLEPLKTPVLEAA